MLIVAYLDDVTLVGDINSVIDDLRTILQTSKQEYGLSLCIKKCEITAPEKATVENTPETRVFTFTPLSDLILLGAPVTTEAALDKILEAKTVDLSKAIQRLSYLHAYDALTLILHSICVPKLLHVLRSSPCANNEFLQKFDDILRYSLSKVLKVDLFHNQWIQATLPIKKSDISIRSVVSLAPFAFLASAVSTFNLQNRILSENLALIPDISVTDT